jgi:NTE family protein
MLSRSYLAGLLLVLAAANSLAGQAPSGAAVAPPGGASEPAPLRRVGVAFGGGSARGIAHIGVIQWFEEQHIPIDVAAGTSMGGLVGGAFAVGMSSAELRQLIAGTDWDAMFGSSSFPFKNVRRKEDARQYPSRLEFGIKGGIAAPTALNDGQQVDFMLARIAAPYYALPRFDDLPTLFRVVAVDLRAGEKVVLDRGSLATALRATMSLPGVFPPVELDGRLLVDGGALDNVPADVVRGLGAAAVIAIDVGYAPTDEIDYSMFGLMGRTVDAMMRASTKAALAEADVTIAVDVKGFGSLDWRRADELIAAGYAAAEARRADLLRYRVSDVEWETWLAGRRERRRIAIPQPTFLTTSGLHDADAALVQHAMAAHINVPLDVGSLERDLAALTGLDRYQSIVWQIVDGGGRTGLLVRARQKTYAPPFLMLGLSVENTTSENFRVQLQARYLAFDVGRLGSELRIDGGLGADPTVASSWYVPFGGTPIFARAIGGVFNRTFNFVSNDAVVAEYRERRAAIEGDVGINLSRVSEVAGGVQVAHVSDTVRAGDPGLPQLSGAETRAQVKWVLDRQDSPVIPSSGTRAVVTVSQTFNSPDAAGAARTNRDLTQAEVNLSSFYSLDARHRLFVVFGAGTSFDDTPLPTRQFTLGYPYVLDAFGIGERRGDHYAVVTLGVQRRVGRLPDFMGGPIFAGLWVENGSAFNTSDKVDVHTQIGGGITLDTLVGPVLLGASAGVDGGWRTIFGVGRIFR